MRTTFLLLLISLLSYQTSSASRHDEVIDSLQSILNRPITDSAQILTLNHIAWKYVYNNFDSAKAYFKKAVLAANNSDNAYAQAFTNLRLGSFYAIHENYTGALNAYLSCLYISKNNNFNDLIPRAWNNLGNLYFYLSDYERSIFYHKKSLKLDRKNPNKLNLSKTLTSIGGPYSKLGHYDSAMLFLDEAEAITRELNLNLGLIYHNRGRLLSYENKLDEALRYYKKSLLEKEKLSIPGRKTSTYIQIGNLFLELNNSDSAEFYFSKAYDIALKLNQYDDGLEVARHLADIKAERGYFKEAYRFNQRVISLADSIKNASNTYEIESRELYHNIEIDSLKDELQKQRSDLMRIVIIALSVLVIAIVGLLVLAFMMYLKKKKMNVILAKKVKEKTLELEKKNEMLEKYAFELSHTIKSPITTILGIINLLDYDQAEEEQTECLIKLKGISKNLDSVLSETTDLISQD